MVKFPKKSKYDCFLRKKKNPLYFLSISEKIPNDADSHVYLSVPVFAPFVCVSVMDRVHCKQRNTSNIMNKLL